MAATYQEDEYEKNDCLNLMEKKGCFPKREKNEQRITSNMFQSQHCKKTGFLSSKISCDKLRNNFLRRLKIALMEH